MELVVTQYWTEFHPLSVSFSVAYHSLRPSSNNFILVSPCTNMYMYVFVVHVHVYICSTCTCIYLLHCISFCLSIPTHHGQDLMYPVITD